jgi:hypothetical protein
VGELLAKAPAFQLAGFDCVKADRLAGARAERDPALERGRHRLRERRGLRRERVAPGVVLRQPATWSSVGA